jgi:hypothetical protein
MMRSPAPNHWLYPWLATAAGLIMLLRLAVSVNVFSPTIDEPIHIGAAVSMAEARKSIALVEQPPLTRWVSIIPLWIDGARLPECRGWTKVGNLNPGYAWGAKVIYHSPTPFRALMAHARLAMLVFPALCLLYLYLLAKWLSNGLVAFASVAFFSIDPTLLGHGFWVCSDVGACAGYLASVYHGLRWLRAPTWRAAVIAGLAIGLSIATKFSCFFVLPALAVMAVVVRTPWRKLVVQTALLGLVAFFAIWGTYLFNVGPLSDHQAGNEPLWSRVPVWIRDTPVPMPSLFLGLVRLGEHGYYGHTAFLNGEVRKSGWWYYFPEAMLLKSTLGFLAALLIALTVCVARRGWRCWVTQASLIPAAVFLAFCMKGKIDIGIRHVLPVYPLLYLFVAWQLARPRLAWVLGALMICAAVETAAVHPDYLSFFNIAAGGAPNGARFLVDSNIDWGQDVYRLADWLKANAAGRPYAIRLQGFHYKAMLSALGLDPQSRDAPPHGRLLCIEWNSMTFDGQLPWLSAHRPIARIGDSILVYDLTGPALPNENDDVVLPDDLEALTTQP